MSPQNSGADDENRTHAISLEGWGSTIELHPHVINIGAEDEIRTRDPRLGKAMLYPWATSAQLLSFKLVEGDGFEPSKAQLTDLQSAPFGHSGIPRRMLVFSAIKPIRLQAMLWSWWRESNPQPADYKSAALPLSHTSEGTVKKVGDLERARTVDLQRDRLAF